MHQTQCSVNSLYLFLWILTDKLHLCPICFCQMPRVWWTSMWTTTVTWMLLTYSSVLSTTSRKLHKVAGATSLAQQHCRLFPPTFSNVLFMWHYEYLLDIGIFLVTIFRSWPWERKVLNVSCPSWNVWWSGVKTNTSTPTLRRASVRHKCNMNVIYQHQSGSCQTWTEYKIKRKPPFSSFKFWL